MGLRLAGYVDLPEHRAGGGFDHAAVHRARRQLFVAHTANDALDVINLDEASYLRSIPMLTGVAGALVDETNDLVFTANRGEGSVGILAPDDPSQLTKVAVGVRPNGLAVDPGRRTLLAANVGDPDRPETHTLSIIDVATRRLTGSIPVAGRTRWTIYDPTADAFFVNIAAPASIAVVPAADPTHVVRSIEVRAVGPHGLDVDASGRLFCACDDGRLVVLDPLDYGVADTIQLFGGPDVIFLDRGLERLYVAIGDPGVVQVIDVAARRSVEVVSTEPGAHTIALDLDTHRVYAFLPGSHRAAVLAPDGI